jgi:hypothetical protein
MNITGEKTYYHGTGYFLTKDLVLTAKHFLPSSLCDLKVRPEIPLDEKNPWLEAELAPVWMGETSDAVLLKTKKPIHEVDLPLWGKASFEENEMWDSAAYPKAATDKTEDGKVFKSAGLTGTLYACGGGGQGEQELELGVEHASKDAWNGVSGAPIFVRDELVGIIKSYNKGFEGTRLYGEPIKRILNEPEFQLALKPQWLPPFPKQVWTLILISENGNEEFSEKVKSAIDRRVETINRVTSIPAETDPSFVEVVVTDALKEPTRWHEVVRALCMAPIMVVDVTDYQPAIMLLLGIRAVVRRGVTIAVTSTELDESLLSELPFNIQETKLIYPQPNFDIDHPRHPINRIGEAIIKGLTQLQEHSGYLDLPAYEAVRCPKPQVFSTDTEGQTASASDVEIKGITARKAEPERILMLCSFHEQYRGHWRFVSEKIIMTFRGIGKSLERMIDISSPRLVGQALYENIRWTPCCIVDWTHWRPNVFFELGVRLACSDIGPVCLIDEEEKSALENGTYPEQKKLLLNLLCPISYKLGGTLGSFKDAYERYNSFLKSGEKNFNSNLTISHNATYRTVVKAYDWGQEAFARLPHEELRGNIEAQQGKDPERDGYQALFSSNAEFRREIQRNGRERWIAAWCYFRKRFIPDDMESGEFKNNIELRKQLSVLTERVVQELRSQTDPNYQKIYKEAVELMDRLDEL